MAVSIFLRGFLIIVMVVLHACGGGGGGSGTPANSSSSAPPKALLASSYENKVIADIPAQLTQLPKLSSSSGIVTGLDAGVVSVPTSLAVADFQQNGNYSAFVIASDGATKSQAYFVGYSATAGWSDLSGTLLPTGVDRSACILPQQSAVADLNKDGRPDVYVACAGVGGAAVTQLIFLSQADGTYAKAPASTWPAQLNASSVALADIDNGIDKCVDVITTDNGSLKIFKGSCAGAYTLTEEPNRRPTALPSNILSVFLVPNATNATQYDLLVGADASNQAYPFKWFANSGAGYFDNTSTRQYGLQWGGASNRYDYLVYGSYGYVFITNSLNQTFVKLARIALPGATSNTTPSYYTPANTTLPSSDWPSYLRVRNDFLEPYDAGCSSTVSTDDSTRCGKRYPIYPLTGFIP